MTINPTAWILLAMYVALAEARGNDPSRLSGTCQTDILKEYIAQKEWVFPIRPSLRLVRDMIVYCAEHLARYNPINISGYHISYAVFCLKKKIRKSQALLEHERALRREFSLTHCITYIDACGLTSHL